MTAIDRRTLLRVTGASGAALAFSSVAGAPAAGAATSSAGRRRAYVLVLDGCRPGEVDQMPAVRALRDAGLWYPAARSLPVTETIPNHVMMMTGCRPARNGVPANSVYDRDEQVVRDCDRPSDIRVTTVIEQLNATGRTTGTVLSKEYLYGVFGTRATHRWEPFPVVPVSGHAPDAATTDAAIAMVDRFDPDLVFVNLGDIDRFGHSDLTGTTLQAARRTALASTNLQVQRFVDRLRTSGRWASSLVVVLADHSMDWSLPQQTVSLTPVLEADPTLAGRFEIAQNGGADLVYWTGPAGARDAAVARVRQLAAATPGVLAAHDVARTPGLRLGAEAGDVLVWCKAGWRFSDPGPTSNPIPGNHGHPATEPIPFFLSGGSPAVARGVARSDRAHTMDVAPTLGAYFGLRAPSTGWEGVSRL
ncbi:Predicted pyrophosphatase or phosphodiesterase, AlkP superfamily [Nocardioides scoriae]|uniref:Predicted pyrophosphatase or phosphodiesterase, AlkP superfamily n=1 Tax=Nocardioides scoriae TaxID=642780 RepID=A0A1H1N4S4_9ACTN|nr:alkaline phosphatase family protein [Nocardioides scoriae]SDR93974.1 Predicted pyrophosphatase or phosphodiesterase, AlkP superfamily [Nocardioides scoriae]